MTIPVVVTLVLVSLWMVQYRHGGGPTLPAATFSVMCIIVMLVTILRLNHRFRQDTIDSDAETQGSMAQYRCINDMDVRTARQSAARAVVQRMARLCQAGRAADVDDAADTGLMVQWNRACVGPTPTTMHQLPPGTQLHNSTQSQDGRADSPMMAMDLRTSIDVSAA